MAAKGKKKDFICGKDLSSYLGKMLDKAFRFKADIRVMKEQKDIIMKGAVEKLGDLSGVTEYTEKDLGNGLFITILPPHIARRFEMKDYLQYLQDAGLLTEAYRRGICRETEEVRETLRFAADYIGKSAETFVSFMDYVRDADLPELAETYLDIGQEIKKLENEYKGTINHILTEGLEKFPEEIFDTRFVYDNGDIKGTLSFSHSVKTSVDLERAGEMLPEDMGDEEKAGILKSGTMVYTSPVINILSEDALMKRKAKVGVSINTDEGPSI